MRIAAVTVEGQSDVGKFSGGLMFTSGLQVISAHNAYGKSLAAKAFAWCLGLEAMFGVQDNDNSLFPLAAREEIEFEGRAAKVISSRCSVRLVHRDGRELLVSRDIKGEPSVAEVEEIAADGSVRTSKLKARYKSMQDEHGGLQRFVFDWLGWPRMEVPTFKGTTVDLYLENLAPLFYIEQDEGWTDIQARQISKYMQQQIGQVAVEYLLGATTAIATRVAQQNAIQREAALRENARAIAEHVTSLFARHGWAVDWTGGGALGDTVNRWTARTLRDTLRDKASVDLAAQIAQLTASAEALRHSLTTGPIDPMNASSHTGASQTVIDIKERRHELNEELHALRVQADETDALVASLEQRIRAADDVFRLKTTGVGRLEHVECPTCHRDLDPGTFSLTDQSAETVSTHIDALKRDRDLLRRNAEAVTLRMMGVRAELARVDSEFRDAERALVTVTAAVGTVREQLAKTAANLSATERQIERLRETSAEVDELQKNIDRWLTDARAVRKEAPIDADLGRRVNVFTAALREYLIALGHSAVTPDNAAAIRLDEQYVPFLGNRRLKSLGSASDRSRVVAAYSLALAAAAQKVGGFHPGVVLLDEPLQQNPDDKHRDLFSMFLSTGLTTDAGFQTIVLTFLRADEVATLQKHGTKVDLPGGVKLLALVPPPAAPAGPTAEDGQIEQMDAGESVDTPAPPE